MMRRVVRTWALDAAAFADVLGRQDRSWGAEHAPVAGGQLVLCGPGMYVNRALGAGLDSPLTDADVDLIESRSAALGVDPAIEITPVTRPEVRRRAEGRGYVATHSVSALRRSLDEPGESDAAALGRAFVIEPAEHQVEAWQATSALGWGHEAVAARRASDAFAAATAVIDGSGFVVARDARTGELVGCASLAIRDSVATLTAMSTVPDARRRGVHAALIAYRLGIARDAGCVVATSTVESGGGSGRNLARFGFSSWFDIITLTKSSPTRPG